MATKTTQFKASYIAESIAKVVSVGKEAPADDLGKINGLLQSVSAFDVEFGSAVIHEPDYMNLNSVLATLNNIICRGLPTLAPITLERYFANVDLVKEKSTETKFDFSNSLKNIEYKTIFELLHIIEPQLTISKEQYGGNLGSNLEWHYIKTQKHLIQVFQSQRDFKTIAEKLGGGKTVDFSFTYPYQITDENTGSIRNRGVIVEVDGSHHQVEEYRYYDTHRDKIAETEGYETLRETNYTISHGTSNVLEEAVNDIFRKNFERKVSDYKIEYALLFMPIAVARIHKTLLEYFISDEKRIDSKNLKLAIVERDFQCGQIALATFQELVSNINELLDENDKLHLPSIELTVFGNEKYDLFSSHNQNGKASNPLFNSTDFDLILDHSVLRRSNIYNETDFKPSDNTIRIRSCHFVDSSFGMNRRVYCANLLKYKELATRQGDGSHKADDTILQNAEYFIQNIFRKKNFREGQLPIISRALQQKPVVGLLPTGGGKSLTYQLPVLLQPGLSIVVDPIKSLMEDQVRVLHNQWIDNCQFINSNLSREPKQKRMIDFLYGESQFFFVSPERFVMEDFRSITSKIDASHFGLAFSYCIIDEVHCVSEWGHDFRTTYLMLGKNAQEYIKTKSENKKVTLIGLTATASFDVLADIERELDIKSNDVANALIMIENTIRPELFFRVVDVTGKDRMKALDSDFLNIVQELQTINNDSILEESQRHHFKEFEALDFCKRNEETKEPIFKEDKPIFKYDNSFLLREDQALEGKLTKDLSGIIFCPTRALKVDLGKKAGDTKGVNFVNHFLSSESKGFFYSNDNDTLNKEIQKHFKEFVEGRTKHMVCTKAFGMGIDKDDIRFTYHNYYSSSLESLVQEVGRSGRDRKISLANILLSKQKMFTFSNKTFYNEKKGDEIEKIIIEKIITNPFHRSQLRHVKENTSREGFNNSLKDKIATLKVKDPAGFFHLMDEGARKKYLDLLEPKINEYAQDRSVHDFFYSISFKGKDVERSQFHSLFKSEESLVTSVLKDIENKYNEEFETNHNLSYWESPDGILKRVYVNLEGNPAQLWIEPLNPEIEHAVAEVEKIRTILLEENAKQPEINLLEFVQHREIEILNDGKSLGSVLEEAKAGEKFSFKMASNKKYPSTVEDISQQVRFQLGNIYDAHVAVIGNKLNTAVTLQDCKVKVNGDYVSYFFMWFTLNSRFDSEYIKELQEAFDAKLDQTKFLDVIYGIQIKKCLGQEKLDFWNFLLLLEERIQDLQFEFNTNDKNSIVKKLRYYFNREREGSQDTGRLIYRMHSMGLLVDYTIDYNKNSLHNCTFKKYDSIAKYLEHIENYLRRYSSENVAKEQIAILKKQTDSKESIIDKILECLYFLSKFAYDEIASKRKRATTEIEDMLSRSILKDNWFEQNKYIKEEIYFYFNAKYARRDFKIKEEYFSLLDDHEVYLAKYTRPDKIKEENYSQSERQKSHRENLENGSELLEKYLNVFGKEGAEQNNYKHMIGSCKKIIRSLTVSDLKKEWVLHLLKAFSMYAVNNISYITEANDEIELGFTKLYNSSTYAEGELKELEQIFDNYFNKLIKNIAADNYSVNIIKVLRATILFKLQNLKITELLKSTISL